MRPVIITLLIYMLSGCFSGDNKIPSTGSSTITLSSDIVNNQAVFMNLNHSNVVLDPFENKWHLKFQNAEDRWSIYLNPMESVAIYQTNSTNFNEIDSSYNLVGREWSIDAPTNQGAYPAIGTWGDFNFETPQSYKNVYIVRIKDELTALFYKVQILDAIPNAYTLQYASLEGGSTIKDTIFKDNQYKHSFLRLGEKAIHPIIEPKKAEWDLCLTYIADSIKNQEGRPYFPTINDNYGVFQAMLVNNEFNSVSIDSVNRFEDINFFVARNARFTSIDQIHNILVEWDSLLETALASSTKSLIVKRENEYFAIKCTKVNGNFPSNFDVEFEIKKL